MDSAAYLARFRSPRQSGTVSVSRTPGLEMCGSRLVAICLRSFISPFKEP